MPRTIVGYDTPDDRLSWTEKLLQKWAELNCSYAAYMVGNDALYWYNERANVGSLAGAAWKSGLYAMEEYTAMKRHGSATEKRSGRIDLYLGHAEQDAIVEAKVCWVGQGTKTATLRSSMRAALVDASRANEGSQKIGAVFYVMKVSADSVAESTLRAEVQRVRQTNPHALAWCFPVQTRQLETDKPGHEGYVWPGVILAMNVRLPGPLPSR